MIKKTGYERKGFDKTTPFLCMYGFHDDGVHSGNLRGWPNEHEGCCIKEGDEQFQTRQKHVDRCKKWLSEYATKSDLLNFSHSSYGLKHDVEKWAPEGEHPEYIPNGEFIKAAIESGYEYIIEYHAPNAYFNIDIKSGSHSCSEEKCFPTGYLGLEPLDQEDYDHRIKSIVSRRYSDDCEKRLARLFEDLLFDRSGKHCTGWYDPVHRIDGIVIK